MTKIVGPDCYPKDEFYYNYYYDMYKTVKACSRCSVCKYIDNWEIKNPRFSKCCPTNAYNFFDAFSSQGKNDIMYAILEERMDYDDSSRLLDYFFMCDTCGACDASCKRSQQQEPLRAHMDFRARLIQNGYTLPQHLPVIESLHKNDNMMFEDKNLRGKWAEGLDVKDLTKENAEVVFHAGCRLSFDKEQWHVARKAINLLRSADVDVGILGKEELCCGARSYDMGYRSEFTKYAESNIEDWKRAGVKTVITACSDGYYIMKRHYPELGADFQVLHIVEFLHNLIKEGRLNFSKEIPLNVTYHDPCHLGRRLSQAPGYYVPGKAVNGIYEEPRDIIKSIPGIELTEMYRIKEYAWCCGAGGGVKEAYPDFSSWVATERLEEAKAVGAEAIVTACPWCERNFIDATEKMDVKIKVYDILDLVEEAV